MAKRSVSTAIVGPPPSPPTQSVGVVQLVVRLKPALRTKFKVRAFMEGRTMNQVLTDLVLQYIAEKPAPPVEPAA